MLSSGGKPSAEVASAPQGSAKIWSPPDSTAAAGAPPTSRRRNRTSMDRLTLVKGSQVHVEWEHLHMGCLACCTAAVYMFNQLLSFPFWVTKVRQQSDPRRLPMSTVMRQVYAEGKLRRGLYRGYLITCGGATPAVVCYALSYQKLKHFFSANHNLPWVIQWMGPLLAGVSAECVYCLLGIVPEVVGQKLQDPERPPAQRRFPTVVREIVAADGLRGFYKGFSLMLAVWGVCSGVWWLCYEHCKASLGGRWATFRVAGSFEVDPGKVLSGSCASTLAFAVANPIDVIKTRVQMDTGGRRYRSAWHAARTLVRSEGLRGLTRGMLPVVLPRTVLGAWSSVTYEAVLHISCWEATSAAAAAAKPAK
eukprot:RCo030714